MIDKLQLLRARIEDYENDEEGKGQLGDTLGLIADIIEAHFQRHDDQQDTAEAAGGLSQVPEDLGYPITCPHCSAEIYIRNGYPAPPVPEPAESGERWKEGEYWVPDPNGPVEMLGVGRVSQRFGKYRELPVEPAKSGERWERWECRQCDKGPCYQQNPMGPPCCSLQDRRQDWRRIAAPEEAEAPAGPDPYPGECVCRQERGEDCPICKPPAAPADIAAPEEAEAPAEITKFGNTKLCDTCHKIGDRCTCPPTAPADIGPAEEAEIHATAERVLGEEQPKKLSHLQWIRELLAPLEAKLEGNALAIRDRAQQMAAEIERLEEEVQRHERHNSHRNRYIEKLEEKVRSNQPDGSIQRETQAAEGERKQNMGSASILEEILSERDERMEEDYQNICGLAHEAERLKVEVARKEERHQDMERLHAEVTMAYRNAVAAADSERKARQQAEARADGWQRRHELAVKQRDEWIERHKQAEAERDQFAAESVQLRARIERLVQAGTAADAKLAAEAARAGWERCKAAVPFYLACKHIGGQEQNAIALGDLKYQPPEGASEAASRDEALREAPNAD